MTNIGKVLVTGGTGNIGSGLVSALCSVGADVRVLARSETQAKALRAQGAEVVVGDLDRPDTLAAAVQGVQRIFLLTWNGETAQAQASAVIAAAKVAGRPHIVRLSAHGTEKSRIILQHIAVEEALRTSGLRWTCLRPTLFMQGLMMAIPTIRSQGAIYMSTGDGRIAMIDVRDIVDVAARVLTSDGHEGKTYVLTGPEAISMSDAAGALTKALGKEVKYVDVPADASRQALSAMGIPTFIVEGLVELMGGFKDGFAKETRDGVHTVTGRPARSIDQFASDFKQAFAG